MVSVDANGLLMDLDSASGRHFLSQAGIVTDLHDFASVPLIQPNDGHALYTISQNRRAHVFTRWTDFVAVLERHIADGKQVVLVHNKGQFNLPELTLKSRHLVIRLNE